ncbi:2-dehydro-3-deoxy-6-phosphogalactonate aldolase [Telmatospirillum sp.]|uniref:2-dehydro-3-deoxy-6-phosphogalactonate aldolase n=1 Tax=Telmatospirillum sp. TaxID=2079197 RepID=UPI002844BFEF|nr:2-dehydro-3-deoxy-6-phosphogalactonate aldolase [Telmatospirillum sp.]MDR3436574.1 2-dehydro-3-deoxy-6-phosphogalactonate aldolase [Telmatospirillum sp.]
MNIRAHLERFPFIGILRGVAPDDVVPIGRALAAEGFTVLEVPLNSPNPFDSIRRLHDALGSSCLIGAGTVMTPEQVSKVAAAGGRLIVMPHSDPLVVRAAKAAGLICLPGVATPTEGFAALANGADGLKLFPAEQFGPKVVKAWRAVFPKETLLLPVGGVTPANIGDFASAGANGFGLGSALYAPGIDAQEASRRARAFADAWREMNR